MKKLIIFAAALLGLFACSRETSVNIGTGTPDKTITLTASVNFGEPDTKVSPDDTNSYGAGYNVAFHWQENDQVLLVGSEDSSIFTIVSSSISADGRTAQFTGTELSDMSSYVVFYAGKNTDTDTFERVNNGSKNTTTVSLDNVAGGRNIVAVCKNGSASGFALSVFLNTFRLRLIGAVTLGKVEYWCDDHTAAPLSVINFGTDGLALTSTAQEVWIPVTDIPSSGATFRFYDENGNLIMEKIKIKDFGEAYTPIGNLISFPELEVKKAASVLLPGKFSVSATKQVQFTKGNLYYSTTDSKYHIESAQNVTYATLGQSVYTADHVCQFFWSNITDWQTSSKEPWASSYSFSTQSTGDKFFCGEDNPITVDGQSGLYALTGGDSGEWNYLFKSRTNASSLYKKGVSVTTSAGTVTNCVVIAPDGYTGSIESSYTAEAWSTAESNGLVCLPAAGDRSNTYPVYSGSDGCYWSSSAVESYDQDQAYSLYFSDKQVISSSAGQTNRSNGYSVRLVHTPAAPVYPEAPELPCVKIGDTWWAPVNCGYDAGHPYGLLYQWGRAYGQGYDGETPAVSTTDTRFSTVADGSDESNKDTFVCDCSVWTSVSTTASDDWFTTYSPCPSGWRVPTYDELNALIGKAGGAGIGSDGWDSTKKGYWFNGSTAPSVGDGLFLPAAGYRYHYEGGCATDRATSGYYWSSSVDGDGDGDYQARYLRLRSNSASMGSNDRAGGNSVRCVQK